MDGGRPWEELSLCLSAVGCSAQVSESPDPGGAHKYCVWFPFLYAPPWAQLAITGQVCCPKGSLAGWLARPCTHAAHLFQTVFHSPPKIQSWTTVLMVNYNKRVKTSFIVK